MTTSVDFSGSVVNRVYAYDVDRSRQAIQDKSVKTLADRLVWVLQNKREIIKNKSRWSEMAGLKRGTVAAVIARDGSMHANNAVALARAAQVSITWLTSGEGEPGAPDVVSEESDPYTSRAVASSQARALGASPNAIKTARLLRGEQYRTMAPAAWTAIMLALSLNEAKRTPQEAQAIIRAFLDQTPEPPPEPQKPESSSETAAHRHVNGAG